MRRALLIGLGGFLGAISRFALKDFSLFKQQGDFPYGTLFVNVTGSFLLVLILSLACDGWKMDEDLKYGLTVGFLGAYTTFSTLCKEIVDLMNEGKPAVALIYAGISVMLGFLAAWAGWESARIVAAGMKGNPESCRMDDMPDELEGGTE